MKSHDLNKTASFDPEALTALLLDDEQLAKEIFITFMEDFPTQLHNLQRFIKAQDRSGVSAQLHSMKGVCAGMGAVALLSLTAEMEKAAETGQLNELDKCLPQLEAQFHRLCADANIWLQQICVND